MVGTDKRLGLVAKDIVEHFERRQEAMDGKAMIVCMSRRVCVDLYDRIVKLRPRWDNQDFGKGAIKVVMTGAASDPERYARHLMTPKVRKEIENRFKKPEDPLKIVIVRDMWLTGFDAPCLHTMYLDKPMHGHGFMQAIARVNRVFGNKPGGLVVDYLGLADSLRRAMAAYTEGGGQGETAVDQETAVTLMKEKYEVCVALFHGFSWPRNPHDQFAVLPAAQEHILALEDGKERLIRAVTELSSAFALSVPHDDAIAIRDDVHFFQAVKAALAKQSPRSLRTQEEYDLAIRQIVAQAVSSDEVIDIFAAAGLEKPNISILSAEFLEEVRSMPHKNLAVELLRKLLRDEIKTRSRTNLVQSRSFAEMLEKAIRAYQNRAIEAAQVIEELIELAKQMKEADRRGESLGLNEAEVAFYDALETNDSAVQVLGDATLKAIAQELVQKVRGSVTIDWAQKESARAKLRVMVKRTLKKYGYPPDKQEKATQTVLAQAELLGWEVAA
jgi:type I restriction enzyme R subunit